MKLWKKILIVVASVLLVFSSVAVGVYNFYIIPKYIEPALEFMSSALMNAEYQDILSELASDLMDDGILDQYTAKTYLRKSRKYTSNAKNNTMPDTDYIDDIDIDDILNEEENEKKKSDNLLIGTKRTSIGIEMIRSDDDFPDAEPSGYHSYSEKQDKIDKNKDDEIVVPDTSVETDGVEITFDKDNSGNGLYNKIFKAMKQHERTTFLSVISQVDVTEIISLYNMGDKTGIKNHLKSRLSDEQYKEAVSIFYKYAPLLYK